MDINDLFMEVGKGELKNRIKKEQKNREPFPEEFDVYEWPDPLTDPKTPSELPFELFPSWLADMVENLSDFLQAPTDLPTIFSLGVLATSVQGKFEVKVKPGFKVPVSLYVMLILKPGNRKSPAVSKLTAPIEEYQEEIQEHAEERKKKAEDRLEILEEKMKQKKKTLANLDKDADDFEGQKRSLQQKVDELREEIENFHVPAIPRLWASDITPQKLVEMLAEQPGNRLSVQSSEGEILPILAGRYDSQNTANLDAIKKAVNNEPISSDRIGRGSTIVEDPNLTMALTVQPEVLQDLKNHRSFEGQGVLGRFSYAIPGSPVGGRKTGRDIPEFDAEIYRDYKQKIHSLLNTDPKAEKDGNWIPHQLELSDAARDRYYQFEEKLENELDAGGQLEHIQDWGGKLNGRVARIAGLLHCADHAGKPKIPEKIDPETFERAAKFTWALVPHAKKAYGELQRSKEDELREYVLRRIKEKLEELESKTYPSLHYEDLYEGVKDKTDLDGASHLHSLLEQLEDKNCIRLQGPPGQGGERCRIKVNPKLTDNPRDNDSIYSSTDNNPKGGTSNTSNSSQKSGGLSSNSKNESGSHSELQEKPISEDEDVSDPNDLLDDIKI